MERKYIKICDMNKLQEEIYVAIPSLKPTLDNEAKFIVKMRLFTNSDTLILRLPDDVDIALIDNIVAAHNPTSISEELEFDLADQLCLAISDLQMDVADLKTKVGA